MSSGDPLEGEVFTGSKITFMQGDTFIEMTSATLEANELLKQVITLYVGSRMQVQQAPLPTEQPDDAADEGYI